MATSRRATARSSSGSSRRSSCAAAATSPTRPSTSASSPVLRKANAGRGPRVAEDIEAMRPLVVERLPEYTRARRAGRCDQHDPSQRLRILRALAPDWRARARARLRARIEVYFADKLELACDRLRNGATRIDYRHVIWSLVRKPGAFARYVYRDEFFPSVDFRRAYDAICAARSAGIKADIEYLRMLHLAASTIEDDVEARSRGYSPRARPSQRTRSRLGARHRRRRPCPRSKRPRSTSPRTTRSSAEVAS